MDIFTALGEPTRRHILEMLASYGHLSTSDIFYKLSVSPPAISQRLKVLRDAKLFDMEKQAQMRLYRVNPRGIEELKHWVKIMKRLWSKWFDRLEVILKNG